MSHSFLHNIHNKRPLQRMGLPDKKGESPVAQFCGKQGLKETPVDSCGRFPSCGKVTSLLCGRWKPNEFEHYHRG
jgi:hypothetical protein